MKLSILSVPVAAAATFLLLASNKVVLGEGDIAQCDSDIDAMVASSPELAQASADYEDNVIDVMTSLLVAVADGESEPIVDLDYMIADNYDLACEDAGGIASFFKYTVFRCVVDSSGNTAIIKPQLSYCEAPTEACDDVWFSLTSLGIHRDLPGYECARLETDSDGGVEVPASGGNVVFGEKMLLAQCTSDMDAMEASSPELAQATVDYVNESTDALNAVLVAFFVGGESDPVVDIDPMIQDDYILACEDAGGVPSLRESTPYYCVDSSGSTLTLTPSLAYCKSPTEACENVLYFTTVNTDTFPGFECVRLDNDVVEVPASGSNVLNWTNDSLMMVAGLLFVTLFIFIS